MSGAMGTVDWSLYLVTDPVIGGGPDRVVDIATRAVAGGATVVQLRDKHATDAEVEATAAALLDAVDVPVFLNDRVEVARRLRCHLHIGQTDMPFPRARALLRDDQMIGLSVGSDTELDAVIALDGRGPDVIGIGPAFDTTTKANAPAGLGVERVHVLADRARAAAIASVAIGGIDADRASLFTGTAVNGICVVSAIMAAADPAAAARDLKEAYTR